MLDQCIDLELLDYETRELLETHQHSTQNRKLYKCAINENWNNFFDIIAECNIFENSKQDCIQSDRNENTNDNTNDNENNHQNNHENNNENNNENENENETNDNNEKYGKQEKDDTDNRDNKTMIEMCNKMLNQCILSKKIINCNFTVFLYLSIIFECENNHISNLNKIDSKKKTELL